MAIEIYQFTLAIPAGTLSAAPVTQSCKLPVRQVDWLQVVVPPGSGGLVGWNVKVSGTTVIPFNSDPFIITANENITWPIENAPVSGDWSVAGYNLGSFSHTVYFRFGVSLVPPKAVVTTSMIDDQALNATTAPTF